MKGTRSDSHTPKYGDFKGKGAYKVESECVSKSLRDGEGSRDVCLKQVLLANLKDEGLVLQRGRDRMVGG
jgi:hypothetical protein